MFCLEHVKKKLRWKIPYRPSLLHTEVNLVVVEPYCIVKLCWNVLINSLEKLSAILLFMSQHKTPSLVRLLIMIVCFIRFWGCEAGCHGDERGGPGERARGSLHHVPEPSECRGRRCGEDHELLQRGRAPVKRRGEDRSFLRSFHPSTWYHLFTLSSSWSMCPSPSLASYNSVHSILILMQPQAVEPPLFSMGFSSSYPAVRRDFPCHFCQRLALGGI